MTVCGNKISGVCVMGKCQYVKVCSPAEWDKGEPMTNEEYIRSCTTEELAEVVNELVFGIEFRTHIKKMGYINMHSYKTEIAEWLQEEHK